MKAFDEFKKSPDSNFRYATPLLSYLAPKSIKITIYGSNCRKASLKGHFLPKKAKKNSDSEVENVPAVVFWAENAFTLNMKHI